MVVPDHPAGWNPSMRTLLKAGVTQTAIVGGVVTPVNKFAIVATYLVLAGLIIAVSAIVIKKRKD